MIVIALYFPIALIDSICYYINGTSLAYDLFSNGLFNPVWGFWAGLIGTIVEIYLVIYFIRKNFFFGWFKGKSYTQQSKIEELDVFISYASEDLNLFRIPEIAAYLESQPEIQKVYYWERDNDSSQTLVEYMEQSILKSDIILIISSQHSLASAPVKKEIEFAVVKNKRIILIFEDFKNVREFIKVYRGVKFNSSHFNDFLNNLISIIKGGNDNTTSPIKS